MASSPLRRFLRALLPAPLRETYHRHALRRDFGIDAATGEREAAPPDGTLARGINVVGYLASPTGVGQSARGFVRAARAAGLPVCPIEAAGLESSLRGEAPYAVNLFHVNADAAASVVELCGPRVHRGRANVGYWYWETEDFPQRWRDRFAYFDEIWVASEFCRVAVAKRSPIPVVVVPPAVLVERAGGALPRASAGTFRFVTVADVESVAERKNPLGVVRAFARAFPGDPRVTLTVKLSNAGRAAALVGALSDAAGSAQVSIDVEPAGRADVDDLIADSDAYVSLHRAEGFGFPIAEAMALGKPVVATDYSGSRDFVDETTGFPVRWRPTVLEESAGPYPAGTRWAEPDEDHAVETLRRVVRDRAERERRAEAGRRRVTSTYGVAAAGSRLAERVESLIGRRTASR